MGMAVICRQNRRTARRRHINTVVELLYPQRRMHPITEFAGNLRIGWGRPFKHNLYMELIFSSESFSEMLNKAEYIEMLSAYDRKMLDKYVETRELIELYKDSHL